MLNEVDIIKKWLQASGIFFILIASLMAGVSGCNQLNNDEGRNPTYSQEDLQGYLVMAESPVEVVHWFNVNHVNTGLHHLFYEGSLYKMATYDGKDYLDMDIDKVILEDKEIIIKAKTGESVLKEGTTHEVDGYSSNVYVIEEVEPAFGGVSQPDPYKMILER